MQWHIKRLAELDDTKPILVACEALTPYICGVLEETVDDSELLSLYLGCLTALLEVLELRMPASCVRTQQKSHEQVQQGLY